MRHILRIGPTKFMKRWWILVSQSHFYIFILYQTSKSKIDPFSLLPRFYPSKSWLKMSKQTSMTNISDHAWYWFIRIFLGRLQTSYNSMVGISFTVTHPSKTTIEWTKLIFSCVIIVLGCLTSLIHKILCPVRKLCTRYGFLACRSWRRIYLSSLFSLKNGKFSNKIFRTHAPSIRHNCGVSCAY